MKNLYFNLDSIESTYGEDVLTTVIQMEERFQSLTSYFPLQESLNDFEKLQVVDRLRKINDLNAKIQHELQSQMQRINKVQESLESAVTPG